VTAAAERVTIPRSLSLINCAAISFSSLVGLSFETFLVAHFEGALRAPEAIFVLAMMA
jgi:hypothetical protein